MARYAMVIDLDKCVGCQACSVACSEEWKVPVGEVRTHIRSTGIVGMFPQLMSVFHVAQCNHCDHPPCILPCPTGATYQAENGVVKVDQGLCIGCGYCVEACPYDARYINERTKKVDKCDFCSSRVERGLQPACVNTCTAHAKYFGDLEDPNSFVFTAVYEKHAHRIENSLAAPGPNVYYLGKPGHLELVQAKFGPRAPRLIRPGEVWKRLVKPLVLAAVGATFVGQAIAFFYQLHKGEKDFEE